MRYLFLRGAIAVLLSISTLTVCAAELRTLTLPDALRTGLQQHPQLHSFVLRTQALNGEMDNASLSPPLTLSAEVENLAGSGDYRSTKSAELTLSLSSVIEPRHQRDARQAVITARQQALANEEQLFGLDLLTDITRQFIAVIAAQEALVIHQRAVHVWQQTVAVLDKRVEAGRSPTAELLRARAALAQTRLAQAEAEHDVLLARMALSANWGKPDDYQFVAQGNLRDVGAVVAQEHILALLEQHPDLRMLAGETRLRDAEQRLARTANAIAPEWQAGIRHLRESDDTALVVGISMPLFGQTRNTGQLKTATAQHQLAIQEEAIATLHLRTQLLRLHEQQRIAIQRTLVLRDEVIPLLAQAVNETGDAFARGRYSYMEWSQAQSELFSAELALIDAATQAHYWRTEIERLSGAPLLQQRHTNAWNTQGITP